MKLHRVKLIEVALPLDEINAAGAREKSVRHGHPSTLHLWWSRKPLAVARAVIFAQMVDDPSEYVDALLSSPRIKQAAQIILKERRKSSNDSSSQTSISDESALYEIVAEQERKRLFKILEELVLWENSTNEKVLEQARNEIRLSWQRACEENSDHPQADELFRPDRMPAFHDPFAGGGSLPLEAQRLGLEAYASDLNPVAVLINKAMIEVPPKFAGYAPVNPQSRDEPNIVEKIWRGPQGLAEDVRYYGQWMHDEAQRRIGHLYPTLEVTPAMIQERPDLKPYESRKLTVIAWLWARTVKSPNPAFAEVDVPLASTFMLSTKKGKEAYIVPIIKDKNYEFEIKVGNPLDESVARNGTSAGKRRAFRCIMSGVPVSYEHIRKEGKAGCIGSRLMAIVAEGKRGRVYLSPSATHEAIANQKISTWKPDCDMPKKHRNFQGPGYGLDTFGDLFTTRQLVTLTTFTDLIQRAKVQVYQDAIASGLPSDRPLSDGGSGATAYAEAVSLYLAMCVSRATDFWSTNASWLNGLETMCHTFSRQALPMMWDFAEANPFSHSGGNWEGTCLKLVAKVVDNFISSQSGVAEQTNAIESNLRTNTIISTDPPYYDNIGYADLSDFFYVWLRRSIRSVYPDLFSTVVVPKNEELVATPYRHGGKKEAESFFLEGMTKAIRCIADQTYSEYPVTIYYAFKQSEQKRDGSVRRTGWETFLDAVIRSGFSITGTWPMRTERSARSNSIGTNALASSVVLVCRKRRANIQTTTRREYITALKQELPQALRLLQSGNVAPVDLAQAAIGPGMAVYTRYASSNKKLFNYVSPPSLPPSYPLVSIAA